MTVVLMFPSSPDLTAQTMNYRVVVLGGVLSLALGYSYFPRYGGVPVANVEQEVDDRSPSREKREEFA